MAGPEIPPLPGGGACSAFSWTSRATWDLLTEHFEERLVGAQRRMMDERAITDIAMTLLRRLSYGGVKVVLFTQSQEAVTGADFELVVIRGAQYLSYLVQAKALKPGPTKEGYPALGEELRGIKQYDRLLDACGPGQPWNQHGALHVFYNSALLSSGANWPSDRCFMQGRDDPARGITVVPTSDLVAAIHTGRPSYRYDRIAPICWPWWCFFCCARSTDLNALAERSAGRLPPDPDPASPSLSTDGHADDDGYQRDDHDRRDLHDDDQGDWRVRRPAVRDLDEAPDYVQLALASENRRRSVVLEDDQARPPSSAVVTVELDRATNIQSSARN